MKTPGIPFALTLLLAFSVINGIFPGLAAMAGYGIFEHMDASWGGRSLGAGLAATVAILLKNPITYLAAFLSSTGREIGDFIFYMQAEVVQWPMVGIIVVLLIGWLVGIWFANRARHVA